jgi:2-iminoacetate synthase ThiH
MSLAEILKLVRGARKIPVERDSFYRVVRTFEDTPDAPLPHSGASVAEAA